MADSENRFEDRNQRVALRIPVELGQGSLPHAFEDAFEANTVNLSRGGLSMRSACLPDPGTRLSCRFRALPSGTLVTAAGEVVWAHLDGADSGEFGLSFVDLDPKSEWLIEEMLAEQARIAGPRPDGEVAAAVAQLELEGSSGAIAARVAREDGQTVVFEQPLDVLSVGRGVRAHADGEQGRKGSITGVELRMVGSVPMLAVTVAFDEGGSSVGFVPAAALEHDTAPDLHAPDGLQVAPAMDPRSTLLEFEAERDLAAVDVDDHADARDFDVEHDPAHEQDARDARDGGAEDALEAQSVHDRPTANPALDAPDAAMFASPLARPAAQPLAKPQLHAQPQPAQAPAPAAQARPARSASPLAPPQAMQPRAEAPSERPAPRAPSREPSVTFRLSHADADDEAELAAMFEPEPSSLQRVATRVLLALRVHGGAALRASGPLAHDAYGKVAPILRTLGLRLSALLRTLVLERVGPQLGALRRMLASALAPRRRRKTTAPSTVMAAEDRSGLRRTVALSVLGATALAMAVYAFAPSASDDALPTTRPVKRLPLAEGVEGAPANPAAQPALDPLALAAAPEPVLAAPDPRAVPSAGSVPSGSPFAVDVRGGRKAAVAARAVVSATPVVAASTPTATKGNTLRFGAAQVTGAKRFTLRMSRRVTALEGAADAGGFTVVALGGLALDRAGPISSALPAVKRSMIINKGDRAELSIRFADGKRPAYQVVADGTTLTVSIQDL